MSCLAVAAILAGTATAAAAAPVGTVSFFAGGISKNSHVASIAPGPDGNLWFTESEGDRVGRITPSGAVTEFSAGISPKSAPVGITTGPDGNVWFTEADAARIGRITPSGAVTEFSAGITPGSEPYGIAAGPDGNVWFAERKADKIGRITPTGAVIEFSAGITPGAETQSIVAGADGNLWFTEHKGERVGQITTAGVVKELPLPNAGSEPIGITAAVDGSLWISALNKGGGEIGQVTPPGTVAEFKSPLVTDSIAAGPDGNLWLAEPFEDKAVRVIPPATIGEFPIEAKHGFSESIAPGADGNLWFTATSSGTVEEVGRIISGAPSAQVSAPVLSGGERVGAAEQCAPAQWSTWAGEQPSSSLFAFDGFSWLLDGSPIASGPSYTPPPADAGHSLSCRETVTYPVLDVSAVAVSAAATVQPALAQPIAAPAPVAPVLKSLRQSASVWRLGSKLANLSRRRRPPVGTTFAFALNESATVTLTFTRSRPGRTVRGRCVAPTKANRRKRSCQRTLTAGALTFAAHAGSNRIVFQGRLSRTRKLTSGRYTLLVVARSAAGLRSRTGKLSFTIVR